MNYPPTAPAPVIAALDVLGVAGKLHGVAPQVLAAICRYTSNFGRPSLGINATGFGGFFGQHVGWAYPGRPQGFTRTELLTPLTFGLQAQVAAATLVSYAQPTLGAALGVYASGTPTGASAFVAYVCGTTGADPTSPLVGAEAPRKETDMISIVQWDTPGQHHLVIVTTTPDGKMITNRLHYWSASTKPGFDVEVLPPPPAA